MSGNDKVFVYLAEMIDGEPTGLRKAATEGARNLYTFIEPPSDGEYLIKLAWVEGEGEISEETTFIIDAKPPAFDKLETEIKVNLSRDRSGEEIDLKIEFDVTESIAKWTADLVSGENYVRIVHDGSGELLNLYPLEADMDRGHRLIGQAEIRITAVNHVGGAAAEGTLNRR